MESITDAKILSKVLRNHLNNDELQTIQRKQIVLKQNSEDELDVEERSSPISKIPEEQHEMDENEEEEIPPLKDIDSGNVSPESIPINSFRADSRLSNITPINVYTPNTFRREQQNQQDNEQVDFE